MSLADGKTCNTCKFWDVGAWERETATYGYCHASPPQPVSGSVGVWPYTGDRQWCGAHKPAPKEAPDGD